MSERVLVAMSGGVDSSVAAALVKESGAEAVGVTLKLLPRGATGFGCCGSPADVDDAKRVCETLGIPHYVSDMAALFEDKVIRPYLDAYLGGTTPNPCVECNRSLKFGHLLALAEAWGCAKVATGHYARVENGRLLMAADRAKDQSYFLHALGPREISKALFPVGSLPKPEVRARARALGLKTADKPESMEVCFVPGRDVRGFAAARAGEEAPGLAAGPIRDRFGRELGRHRGLAAYTVGQRSGLGRPEGGPLYVAALEPETNSLVVDDESALWTPEVRVGRLSWCGPAPSGPFRAELRLRHRHPPAPADLSFERDVLIARFDEPQRAPAPGQSAVLYSGELVLGGGTILRGGGQP